MKTTLETADVRIHLTTEEACQMAAIAAVHIAADPIEQPEAFCEQGRSASRLLPARIFDALMSFADDGNDLGFVVVDGLQVGTIEPTPLNNRLGVGGRTLLAKQQTMLSHVVGEMISYEAEGCGLLIQDMVPNPDLQFTQQSQGSRTELEAHTEQCHSPLRPDYIVLGCLRGDPEARTFALSARRLVELLTPAERRTLAKPLWTTRIDDSFKPYVPDPDAIRGPFPILAGDVDDPDMLVDQDLSHGICSEADQLLDRVVDLYVRHRQAHTLKSGEVLILDNLRAMHGRSAFTPRFDGNDRFITRGFRGTRPAAVGVRARQHSAGTCIRELTAQPHTRPIPAGPRQGVSLRVSLC